MDQQRSVVARKQDTQQSNVDVDPTLLEQVLDPSFSMQSTGPISIQKLDPIFESKPFQGK